MISTKNISNLTEIGTQGVQIVAEELIRRGYTVMIMPNHNVGFDIGCAIQPRATTPGADTLVASSTDFEVEVKCSTSMNTHVPMQIKTHLECPLRHRFYVVLKNEGTANHEFFIMSHDEIQIAWELMPKVRRDGQPYVIRSTGYIGWQHIQPHQDRWDKLPA
jgi:hypothetical protein